MTLTDSSENRKKLCLIYNEVTKEIFAFGSVLVQVEIRNNTITYYAKQRRLPFLKALEETIPNFKREVDLQITNMYKVKLKEKLEKELSIKVETVFRDFDSTTLQAYTNITLSES